MTSLTFADLLRSPRRRRRIGIKKLADSRISVNSGISEHSPAAPDRNERITINVGGVRHETFRSTLRIYPDTRLGWIAVNGSESIDAYDPIRNEYFFDRNPTVFSQIVNFYRTGKLHSPSDICGPLFEEELTYWGLDEKAMEPCCWSRYTEHRDAQENLKVFDNPVLNPVEEDPLPRVDQDYESSTNTNMNIFRRVIKSFYPSFIRSEKWQHFKRATWLLFEDRASNNVPAKIFTIISLLTILISVMSLCLHSMVLKEVKEMNTSGNSSADIEEQVAQTKKLKSYSKILLVLDILTCLWMTIEFILRFISCPNRMSFMKKVLNIVDLLSILPYLFLFYVGREEYIILNSKEVYTKDREWIHIAASVRLFRLLRFFRLSTGLEILQHTMIASGKEILLLIFLLAIPVIISATFVYHAEKGVTGTAFDTIPKSVWWAIITMTTVGYGDMAPKTAFGMAFGAISASMSVVLLALPVSIIGNNFQLFYHYAQARLKLPKRPKNVLVGAANALVAEPSQCSMSPEMDERNSDESDNESNDSKSRGDLKLPDGGYHSKNRRFQRDRLSLYSTANSRYSIRRSKSMGTVPNEAAKDTNETFPHSARRLTNVGLGNKYDDETPVGKDNEAFVWKQTPLKETQLGENNNNSSPDIRKKKDYYTHTHDPPEYNNNLTPMDNQNNHITQIPRTIVTVADNSIDNDDKMACITRNYYSPPLTRKYNNQHARNLDVPCMLSEKYVCRTRSDGSVEADCNHQQSNNCNNSLCVP